MKKKLLPVISAVLSLTMLLSLAACGKEKQPDPQPSDSFVPVSLIAAPLEKQEYDKEDKLVYEYCLDIVEFSGGAPGAAANMTRIYNQLLTQPTQEFIAAEVDYLLDEPEYPEFLPDGMHGWHNQSVRLLRSDDTLVSVAAESDVYSAGAAHGSQYIETLNFDPLTGEVVSISDLGINGADPTDDIIMLLAEKHMAQTDYPDYVDGLSGAAEVISESLEYSTQSWYITDQLVFIANPYNLAPYIEGIFEIALSPEELEGIVDSRWFGDPVPEPQTMIYRGEAEIRNFDTVHVVGDYGYEMNYVWFEQDAYNVCLSEIEYTEDGDFTLADTIDTFSQLKEGEALLLDIMVPEGMPNTVLMADINGQFHIWFIGYNGRDGGISFVETELHRGG